MLLSLAACAAAGAQAAVGHFDAKNVYRPKAWGAIFKPGMKMEDHSKVSGCIYGVGIAKPYVEKVYSGESMPEGHTTYRVYLVLDKEVAYNAYALYGSTYEDMVISTEDETDFYQAPPGIDVELGGVNPALFQFVPAGEYDSWLTIGADSGDTQSALSVVGIVKFGNQSKVTTDNGALFASDPGVVPDNHRKPDTPGLPAEYVDSAVLIGQLTVKTGTAWTWVLNAQGKSHADQEGNTWQEHGICITTTALDSGCDKHPAGDKRSYLEKDEL
eukprot:SAG22_NODE_483_length_9925_cov_3.568186_2_plen_272_part_00